MHIVYFIIILIAIIEAFGQLCLKKGVEQENNYLYFIGILSYSIITYLLLKTYKYKGIIFSNLMWSSLSILLSCINGKIFFGEKINYPACILIISSIYLINKE